MDVLDGKRLQQERLSLWRNVLEDLVRAEKLQRRRLKRFPAGWGFRRNRLKENNYDLGENFWTVEVCLHKTLMDCKIFKGETTPTINFW